MAINPVSNQNVNTPRDTSARTAVSSSGNTYAAYDKAAVFERSEYMQSGKLYTKNSTTMDDSKYSSLSNLVKNFFSTQSAKAGNLKELFQNLQVDASVRLQAQQDISEDGYWGVEQTSQRIIDLAIRLSGGDPEKLAELKQAVEKGYSAAERAWGGALPGICQKTKDATLKGLDDWAAGQVQ